MKKEFIFCLGKAQIQIIMYCFEILIKHRLIQSKVKYELAIV
jgi:hypothetical protein